MLPLLRRTVSSSAHRLFRQPFAPADPLHPDVVLHDPRPLFDQVLLEQLQEEIEFLGRPLPVLAGEAIERDLLDAQPGTFLGHAADAGHAAAMSFDPRQAPPAGPTPVAVHDDGDVPRQPLPREVGQFGGYIGGSRHVVVTSTMATRSVEHVRSTRSVGTRKTTSQRSSAPDPARRRSLPPAGAATR